MKRENWNIITKYLSGEILETSEKEYIDQVSDDAEMEKILAESEETLQKVNACFELNKIDTNKAWDQVASKLSVTKKRISFPVKLLRIAAVFILIVAGGLLVGQLIEKTRVNQYMTAQNDLSRPEIILADGTRVILSYGSHLTYPKKFKGKTRRVQLIGEAFFDVSPNVEKPFVIQTETASVKVLGTSFNVYAYEGDQKVEVVVKTGKVELREGNSEHTLASAIILLPGEKGTFENNTRALFKEVNHQLNSLAWMTHDIKFDFTKLGEVIETLEHVYNLHIEVDSEVDIDQLITATFKQQNPDYVMEVVAITLDLDLKKTGNNSYRINK